MSRFKNRSAWIVEWELHRRDLKICDTYPHILPHRWEAERVFDYMRCLFWNSALWTAWETLDQVNRHKPQGVFRINQGPRLIYGMSTILVACRVNDLLITEDGSGKCVMKWTRPAGIGTDPETLRAVPIGNPVTRRLALNDWHSETVCLPTD